MNRLIIDFGLFFSYCNRHHYFDELASIFRQPARITSKKHIVVSKQEKKAVITCHPSLSSSEHGYDMIETVQLADRKPKIIQCPGKLPNEKHKPPTTQCYRRLIEHER
jgi:hypothetical protein